MTADARETRRKVGETRNTHGLWQYNELGKKQRHKNQCNNIDIPHTERRLPQNLPSPSWSQLKHVSESQPDRHAASRAKPSQQPHQASSLAQGRADKDKTCRHSPTALPRNLSKRQLALLPPASFPQLHLLLPLFFSTAMPFSVIFSTVSSNFGSSWCRWVICPVAHLPSWPFGRLAVCPARSRDCAWTAVQVCFLR